MRNAGGGGGPRAHGLRGGRPAVSRGSALTPPGAFNARRAPLCLPGYWSTERLALPWCWQGVAMSDVMAVLRARQGVSGITEKAARPPKQ